MEMSNAMNVLTENGISVKRTTVTKEGREKDALAIGTGSIVPTIYEENIVNIHNEDEMLRFAMSLPSSFSRCGFNFYKGVFPVACKVVCPSVHGG